MMPERGARTMAIAAAGTWRPTNSRCLGNRPSTTPSASVTLSVPPARNAGLPCWICWRWRPSQGRSSAAMSVSPKSNPVALERQVEGQKAPRMISRTGEATGAEGGGGTRALKPTGVASGGCHLRIGRAQHLPVRIDQRDEGKTRRFPLSGRQSEAALSATGAILEEFGGGGQQQPRTLANAFHIARQQCRLPRREVADLGLALGPLAPAYDDLEPDGRDEAEGDDQEQPNGDRHAADPTAPAQPAPVDHRLLAGDCKLLLIADIFTVDPMRRDGWIQRPSGRLRASAHDFASLMRMPTVVLTFLP